MNVGGNPLKHLLHLLGLAFAAWDAYVGVTHGDDAWIVLACVTAILATSATMGWVIKVYSKD